MRSVLIVQPGVCWAIVCEQTNPCRYKVKMQDSVTGGEEKWMEVGKVEWGTTRIDRGGNDGVVEWHALTCCKVRADVHKHDRFTQVRAIHVDRCDL